jgi:osmotically-inducible protein OsmY
MRKNILFLFIIAAGLFLGMTVHAIAQGSKKDLESRVKSALSSYFMHNLSVSVDEKGVALIKGSVDALYDKLDIYQIVSGINGVTEIKDLVYVNTPTMPDAIIEANIVRTIKDNSVILEPENIAVTVTDGLVFLRGTVSFFKEKLMATTISSWQDGVKGVENEINVLPPLKAMSDENIKSILNDIIENHFPLENGNVSVIVANGDVTVEGEVQGLWGKNHLKEEFLQVSGVKSVADSLKIKPR